MYHSIHSFTELIFYRTLAIGKTERIKNIHIGSLTLGGQYIKGKLNVYTCDIRQVRKIGN